MFNLKRIMKNVSTGKLRFGILTITAIGAFIGISGLAEANNIRWYLSPSDPYIQTWSDTNAINIDDNWDNLIAINGYRGDGLTTTAGVNPQTVLADGESTPIDVNANRNDPNTFNTGGVTEFDGIPNPTVALKGSTTASAPNLVIALNKSSCPDTKFISVSYKLRDLDGSANDAMQAVALQYRVGTTGNYTNVPGAYVADATLPNSATKVTNVAVNLPHITPSINEVYIRILTTNAVGTDEWVGVDDINIGCFAVTASQVPVSGRVMSPKGSGVSRATVIITDQEGNSQSVKTNTFGYYTLNNVDTGNAYVLNVFAKGYQYDPKVVAVQDSITDLDFYPQE